MNKFLYHFARIWIGGMVGLGVAFMMRLGIRGMRGSPLADSEMFIVSLIVIAALTIPEWIAYGAYRWRVSKSL